MLPATTVVAPATTVVVPATMVVADDDDDGNRTDNQACGECRNCALFASATHPDFHVLTPETEWHDGRVDLIKKYCDRYQDIAAREKRAAPSRVIPVDQVRLLIERFGAHASIAARKIALIVPADRMNANAANALLKLLEEPPDGAVLILTSATPGYLPATIRSRCLQIPLPPPSAEVARQWLQNHLPEKAAERALQLTGGAPLDALKLHESGFLDLQNELQKGITELTAGKISALDLAAKLNKNDFQQTLDWLQRHNFQTIKKHHATEKSAPDQLPPEPLFALHDKITHYQKIARDQLNEQLALEELILSLQNAMQVK